MRAYQVLPDGPPEPKKLKETRIIVKEPVIDPKSIPLLTSAQRAPRAISVSRNTSSLVNSFSSSATEVTFGGLVLIGLICFITSGCHFKHSCSQSEKNGTAASMILMMGAALSYLLVKKCSRIVPSFP